MILPQGGIYGVKCICNGVNVYVIGISLIKRPHVL
jgi:hypothetical protein